MSQPNFLNESDIDTLINLLLRSQQSRTREALCFSIGIDPKRLSFIRDSSDSDFFLLLIRYLNEIGEQDALCKLCCKELLPTFRKGTYAPILSEIAEKLGCNQEFIHNSNNGTAKKLTSIENIVKPKSKLLIGRASFLFISALTLSAIYSYLWFPDIWSSETTEVRVNAQSDPWLAGMPDKSQASSCPSNWIGFPPSIAPQNSPTKFEKIPIIPDSHLRFKVQKGTTRVYHGQSILRAEGNIKNLKTHYAKAENGISDIHAPIASFVGVFLGADQPDNDSAPSTLDFSEEKQRNYFTISPQLKQVFFMGDGRTNMGIQQRVIVPSGAERLYLGIMDGCSWRDNKGFLDVEVNSH